MRLRRLCQKKKSGRKSVDDGIIEDYLEGGEKREILEMSLLRSLAKHGTDRTMYKKVRGDFVTRVTLVKEKMMSREQEVMGHWMTEEKLRKEGNSSKTVTSIINYCKKFPNTLVRLENGLMCVI
ncbi:unnamed protein product [Effrenium voratum]|uniref:Uncharacterized protein n=1 Tax=Effrenium voratum TaxID=2562239 RepID=A0AA36J8R2_9DINO|nr:unnamed protein product [Effrenium voratum]CAJ1440003.1 unnamed protein product [Effrenium voratum]